MKSIASEIIRNIVWLANLPRVNRLKTLRCPEEIVLFITSRCSLRCDFCFYSEMLNSTENEMSLQELTLLAKSLNCNHRLVLTGGEPFLREDIDGICRIFLAYSKPKFINIPTNGFMTDEIHQKTKAILGIKQLRRLKISISIDATGEKHDLLRGTEGAFDSAVRTLKLLLDLRSRNKNLFIEISAVINRFLLEGIEDFISYFSRFRVPIKFSVLRDSKNSVFNINKEILSNLFSTNNIYTPSLIELADFYKRVDRLNINSSYKFWSTFQRIKVKNLLKALKEKRRVMPCYAGKVDAVIYPNADVAFCENTKSFSNLRDYNFDFSRLWNDECAKSMRKQIEHCSCIHGCNMVTSMLYDSKVLADIVEERLYGNSYF